MILFGLEVEVLGKDRKQRSDVEVLFGLQRRWTGHKFDVMEVKPNVHGCDGLDMSREGLYE